jgi:hypothetical protein
MSENHDDFEENFDNGGLSDDELMQIQAEYRKQKLKENLIGPVISTAVHVAILVLCAVFFVGGVVEKNESVEITPVQEEVPQEEPPPPPPPLEIPPPEPQEVVSHDPQVTSDAVPDAADLVGAIDDVSDEPPSTDDNAEADLVSDIKPSASSIVSSKMFGGRSSAGRAGALKSYGGSVAAQQALHKALKWLASVQNPDGSWGGSAAGGQGQKAKGMPVPFNGKMNAAPMMKAAAGAKPSAREATGLTGLALLVFLAHGETPKSKTYGNTVSKAINWLVNDPAKKEPYSNGIKAYALSEAYAMTGNYAIATPLEKFMGLVIKGQQASGSYEYGYKDEGRQDLSVAGWNYQAMKACKGSGLEVDGLDEAIEKSIKHLTDGGKRGDIGNGYNYNMAAPVVGTKQTKATMRAVGVLCMQLLGEGDAACIKDELEIISTLDLAALNWDKAPNQSLYGWYYATQCMFQAGGKMWKAWNNVFQKELKNNQNPMGYWDFPGKAHGPHTDLGMKIYATCFASLMLTVYYRYLPMTAKGGVKKKMAKKPTAKEKAKAAGEEEIDIF